ncbi:MAG: hypothetical protein IID51_11250 [Proteobacteria bacterium]|nr:hypothetical protein [Pseudomonadota bacterium]
MFGAEDKLDPDNGPEEIINILGAYNRNPAEIRDYFSLDHRESALQSLESLENSLGQVFRKSGNWKWVIIKIHDALFQAITGALSGHNELNHLRTGGRKKKLKILQCRNKKARQELINGAGKSICQVAGFDELWKRACGKDWMHGQCLEPNPQQTKEVEEVMHLRNYLIHPDASVHSIWIPMLPSYVRTAIDFTTSLLRHHPYHVTHFSESQRERLSAVSQNIKDHLTAAEEIWPMPTD